MGFKLKNKGKIKNICIVPLKNFKFARITKFILYEYG